MRNQKVLLLILVGIIGFCWFYIFLTPSALNARKNVENIQRINIGMTKENVLDIMGRPDDKRISFLNSVDSMYYYEPPFGASEGIYIQFGATNTVNEMVDYK